MRALRVQYFLAFAVMGSVVPYLAVYLRERGLSQAQVGWVSAMTGISVLLSPVVMTLAADMRIANRRLLMGIFVACGLSYAAMANFTTFWGLAAAFALASLALAPIQNLQDGLNFAEQDRRLRMGRPRVPFHRVRVFGTVGFIVPSLLLYFLLAAGMPTRTAIWTAVGVCTLGAVNTLLLPGRADAAAPTDKAGLPTLAALRALAEPHLLVFCVSMWLCQMGTAVFYAFYPIYLTEVIGVQTQWVGLIACIGVVIEIGCMLAFGWVLRKMGLRGLMAWGMAAIVVRMSLLWLFPNIWIAVGTQIFHGLMVLVLYVTPPIYLNRRAEPAYRNSIQGLYAMLVFGTGRLIGNGVGGYVAEVSVPLVFAFGAGLCALGAALVVFAFKDHAQHDVEP